ncbi:MAG: zinc ribbon domain-containing protein [Pseudomonadota bacterium]
MSIKICGTGSNSVKGELPVQGRTEFRKARRPRFLLSGLLECCVCGGGLAKENHHRYGCTTRKNKGTCSNNLKIEQVRLEKLVLHAVQKHLMDPSLCEEFCCEYARRMNELRARKLTQVKSYEAELSRLDGAKKRIVKAVIDGFANQTLKKELDAVEARYAELERLIETTDTPPVLIHPNMAHRYRQEVSRLVATLSKSEQNQEAIGVIRSLIEKVVLTPNEACDDLRVALHGELAGILKIAMEGTESGADNGELVSVLQLVAEECYPLKEMFVCFDVIRSGVS